MVAEDRKRLALSLFGFRLPSTFSSHPHFLTQSSLYGGLSPCFTERLGQEWLVGLETVFLPVLLRREAVLLEVPVRDQLELLPALQADDFLLQITLFGRRPCL